MAYNDGMTFPTDPTQMPYFGDNSAAIGSGLGQQLSNLQPSQLVYDPFQFQRPQYMDMLSKLAQDPSSITQTPWYGAGIESVKRGMSKGYLDSGNMALALSKYGQDAYYKQISTLAALAGGGMGATNVGGAMVGGRQAGADLQSKALGTQRYQDLQRLLSQAQGRAGNSGANPWGPAGTPGGTKLPPYPQAQQRGGQPGRPGQPDNKPDGDYYDQFENDIRDIFNLGPNDDLSEIYNQFGGDSPTQTADWPQGPFSGYEGGTPPFFDNTNYPVQNTGDNLDYSDFYGDFSGGEGE